MAVCISFAVQLLWISWLSLLCAGQPMRCLRNRVISDDTALLSATHNITALHDSIPAYPLKNITKAFWCANIGIGNYVNMIFSQPVIIEGIISSGATSNNSQVHHYVSSFTMLRSETVNGPLQLYSVEDFTAPSAVPKYTFVDSLAGLRFQFRINHFQTDAVFCWGLRIIGCTLDNVTTCPSSTTQPATTTILPLPSSSTTQPATTILPLPSSTTQQTSQDIRCPTTVQVVTITVQPTCATVHNSSSQTIPVVGIGTIGGGAAVLLVGVVMIVTAITLCVATRNMKSSLRRQSTISNNDNFYRTTSSHEESTLANKLHSDDTAAAPEYETISNFQPVVATPNQSYMALGRNW